MVVVVVVGVRVVVALIVVVRGVCYCGYNIQQEQQACNAMVINVEVVMCIVDVAGSSVDCRGGALAVVTGV